MVDYPKMPPFETVLLLDTIEAETPSLPYEESNKLYQEVMTCVGYTPPLPEPKRNSTS